MPELAVRKTYYLCNRYAKMKRALTAILAVLYLSTSLGTTVHLHYCMGKLVDWDLQQTKNIKCSNCGMDRSENNQNGCCKDEYKKIKNDNDQKLSEVAFNLLHVTISALQFELPVIKISSITEANPVSNAPPRSHVAIHIRNCVFLI